MELLILILIFLLLAFVVLRRTTGIGPIFSSLRSLIQNALNIAGVKEWEYENCLKWAFGKDALDMPTSEWDDSWRELHSDLFMVRGDDLLYESLTKIGRAYLKRTTVSKNEIEL